MKIRVLSRVRDQSVLAADRLPKHSRAADHLSRNGPIECCERPVLIHDRRVGPETPRDTTLLDELQRRHVVGTLAMDFIKEAAENRGTRVNGRIHPQFPHSLDMRRIDLVQMNKRPPQIPDRVFLIDLLDRVQESLDACGERGVHVKR